MRFFMRIPTKTLQILSAAAIFAALAVSVQAAGTPAVKPTPASAQNAVAASPEVKTLRSALELLRGADHDYQGHRAIAMKKIAEACRLLNNKPLPAAGAGRGGAGRAGTRPATTRPAAGGQKTEKPEPETQAVSDAQLKQAQGIVQGVLSSLPAGTKPEVTTLLTDAVSELSAALIVK
jgi:hypothetical protein